MRRNRTETVEILKNRADRSAWNKGVTAYAIELLEDLDNEELPESGADLEKLLLNGARNWSEYSWGGCAFVYDSDIAERLCTPSELKKTRNGEWRPNREEEWLDVQARALHQAAGRIRNTSRVR